MFTNNVLFSKYSVKHLMKFCCVTVSFHYWELKIGKLEDTRNRTLHGILRVQSCFRGYQARHHARERIRGVLALQSCMFSKLLHFKLFLYFTWFCTLMLVCCMNWVHSYLTVIRGENARRHYSSLLRKYRATTILQKNVRCWLARRYFTTVRRASVIIQSGM